MKRPGVVPSELFARFQHTEPEMGLQLPEAIGRKGCCEAAASKDDVEVAIVHASDSALNLIYVNGGSRIKFP